MATTPNTTPQLLYRSRLHPIRLTWPLTAAALTFAAALHPRGALALTTAAALLVANVWRRYGRLPAGLAAAAALLTFPAIPALAATTAGVYAVWRLLDHHQTIITLDTGQISRRSGIITSRVDAMALKALTDHRYDRPPLGRLLPRGGYGHFHFESAGQDQALARIRFIPAPDRIEGIIRDLT